MLQSLRGPGALATVNAPIALATVDALTAQHTVAVVKAVHRLHASMHFNCNTYGKPINYTA